MFSRRWFGGNSEPSNATGAITACEQGLDFADALHLALSSEADRFYTFDANLRRRAPRAMPGVQVSAPG